MRRERNLNIKNMLSLLFGLIGLFVGGLTGTFLAVIYILMGKDYDDKNS